MFLFLEDHNIGRDHALFYEAYAAYLELKGNFSQADLVYQEGVKRCVSAVEWQRPFPCLACRMRLHMHPHCSCRLLLCRVNITPALRADG